MKADFETMGAIIAFLTSAAGIGGLIALLTDGDYKELLKTMSGLVRTDQSDLAYTRRTTQKLGWYLFTGILTLNIVNLAVYAVILSVLIIGPERLPPGLWTSAAVTPFTLPEKILYFTWFVISLLVYIFRCILPTIDSFSLYHKARKWLKKNRSNG
jgi:hypothetical protein